MKADPARVLQAARPAGSIRELLGVWRNARRLARARSWTD